MNLQFLPNYPVKVTMAQNRVNIIGAVTGMAPDKARDEIRHAL
jgi:hypothetical protein